MPIMMVQEIPGGTREQYEQVAERLTDNGFNAPGDWPVEGLLSHVTGPTDTGWIVVDVWESEEAFQRFGEIIGPVLQEIGMGGEPRMTPVHNFVK